MTAIQDKHILMCTNRGIVVLMGQIYLIRHLCCDQNSNGICTG